MRPISILALFPLFLLTACGVGGGGDEAGGDAAPSSATTVVTAYHASGRPAATGAVLTGTEVRTGTWTEFHDQDGSPKRWEGVYADGAIDQTAFWCEWNADGSVRADQTDH